VPEHLRALVYILLIAAPVFVVAKKIALPLIGEAEFSLWRNCWLAATCLTFLSGSFFVFAVAMALMSIYIHRKSSQPILLYLVLMFVAPCIPFGFGIPGILNRIMDLNPPMLLALFILLPVAVKLWRDTENRVVRTPDIFVLSFYILISLLAVRHGDINSILRFLPGHFIVVLLPYFVFSRSLRSARDVNQAMLAFAVAAMPMAAIGLFEFWKSWRIYNVVMVTWNPDVIANYLFRDGLLRAATTSVEAIAFGIVCMTGAGCLLAVRATQPLGVWRHVVFGILLAGLWSSVSRGPWVGMAICVLVILLLNGRTAMKVIVGFAPIVIALLVARPAFLVRFLNLLPFVGSADEASEAYRSMLFESSLVVIGRYPFFGTEAFLNEPEMQRMIQGQGIIDVVNSYLQIALEYGLVALSFFCILAVLLAFGLGSFFIRAKVRFINYPAILGLLIGIMVAIGTTSSVSFIPYIYWSFFGMCSAILALGPSVGWSSAQASGFPVGSSASFTKGELSPAGKMRVLRPR
jgi:hypothetical protein